ncbi:MAG TPA: hypothetical protein VGB15_15835 [Longimicrobium sp.]|jgi:hypothetical protein
MFLTLRFRRFLVLGSSFVATVLAACDQPVAPHVSPAPVPNVGIAPSATATAGEGDLDDARAVLRTMVVQWNTPGSAVHADAARVIPHTRLAARAAEAERGDGGWVSVEGLIARGRRAAAAAEARTKVAPR